MIKKISFLDSSVNCVDYQGYTHNVAEGGIINKINELVDAVNGILAAQEQYATIYNEDIVPMLTPQNETPADPYAEQRKWIGCLVEYGNADDGFRYGILTNIEPRYSAYPFEIDNGRDATADCWLPSKTIFYKGDNNE